MICILIFQAFSVTGKDESKIRAFFNVELIQFFENHQIYHIESNGDAIIIFNKIKLARTDETIANNQLY